MGTWFDTRTLLQAMVIDQDLKSNELANILPHDKCLVTRLALSRHLSKS